MKQRRERFLFTGIAVVMSVGLLVGCSSGTTNAQKDQVIGVQGAKKPFEGKTISLVTANHPWGEAVKALIPEFEQQTGAKVELQSYFEDQLTQKLTVQFTTGSTSPDVFMYRPSREGMQFFKNGWVQPLDEYVKKDAAYDFNDFSKSALGTVTVDGKLGGIPIITEQEILYYRKDLLEKNNIAVPKTMDDLLTAAKKLHDPKNEMYGFIARGQRATAVIQMSSFLYSEGGDFIQGDKATVNTPEALKAFTSFGTLLKDYGPPGVLNMSWPQAMGLFAQGKVAFYTDATSIYNNATDPQKSKVSDKVGFATFPAGKAGSKPYNVAPWGLAMNAKSANKDAAWAFIQWATSKDIVLKTQQKGNPGARASVWSNPEGTKGFPPEMVPIIKQSAEVGVDHVSPVLINIDEARDVVGGIIEKAILGEDVKAEAEKANKGLQAIIDKEKKSK